MGQVCHGFPAQVVHVLSQCAAVALPSGHQGLCRFGRQWLMCLVTEVALPSDARGYLGFTDLVVSG